MENKTNVMRILDKAKINYKVIDYSNLVFTNANDMAIMLHLNPLQEFKTLNKKSLCICNSFLQGTRSQKGCKKC